MKGLSSTRDVDDEEWMLVRVPCGGMSFQPHTQQTGTRPAPNAQRVGELTSIVGDALPYGAGVVAPAGLSISKNPHLVPGSQIVSKFL